MEQKFIEAVHQDGPGNWGKFLVQRPTEEWRVRSVVDDGAPLLRGRGWAQDHVWVHDLQTGEGAMFRHGGHAAADLNKHRIWVCPLFEPFLAWLYKQDISDLSALPAKVYLPEAEGALRGHRRPGPDEALELAADAMKLDPTRANNRTAVAAMLFGHGAEWLRLGLAQGGGEEMPEFSTKDLETVQAALEALAEVWVRTAPPSRPGVVL